jgi:hypothetical protein
MALLHMLQVNPLACMMTLFTCDRTDVVMISETINIEIIFLMFKLFEMIMIESCFYPLMAEMQE